MRGGPIRKNELTALEGLARGQSGGTMDEPAMARLLEMGLIEQHTRGWRLTKRGTMDLLRRKSLQRTPTQR